MSELQETTTTPPPVKLAIVMTGLSVGFMLLHLVVNTLTTSTLRIPPASVVITTVFVVVLIGLIRSNPWGWWAGRIVSVLGGIVMLLSAVQALWVLRHIHERPHSPLIYITILIMLLQPAPPFATFFALAGTAARSHFGVRTRVKGTE